MYPDKIVEPLPLTDLRFPGLRFEYGRLGAKKTDPDYRDRIVSDDTKFDIFQVPDTSFLQDAKINLLPVTPFTEYTKGVAFLDCEWVGSEYGPARGDATDILVAIGLKCRGKHYIGCNKDKTEKELLEWFYRQLSALRVHTIAGFSIYGFYRDDKTVQVDLGMIYHRSLVHGLSGCPWKPKTGNFANYKWNNAIVFGRPLEVPSWECDQYELIDLYPQTVLYDSLVRKLDNYRLKDSVIGFGLRDDRRIEIGHQVYDYYSRGEIDTLVEYLKFDLDDSELLWNFLIPQKYFMKSYMDMSLQRITTTGTGSWWNQYLVKVTGSKPNAYETCSYQGALTFYHAGVYRNCVKFDFSGLYPSIMMTYGICSSKDKDKFMLRAISAMGKYRSQIKKSEAFKRFESGIVDSEGIDADGKQHTAKILRNGGYGVFNTTGLNYNDPMSGAAICSFGRNLVRYMISWLAEKGAATHGCDTDGIYVSFVNDSYTDDERHQKFIELCNELNKILPGFIEVAYEDRVPLLCIPPNLKDKKASKILADKLNTIDCYENVSPDQLDPGLSKNYLYFVQKHNGYKIVKKGKFKKRGFSYLDSGLYIDYITKLFYDGDEAAIAFAQDIRQQISTGDFPLNKLQKTVLVASNWKEFPKYGFSVGSKPTIHYVWRGEYTGVRVIKKVFVPSDNPDEKYATEYYLDRFDELIKSFPNGDCILKDKLPQLALLSIK